MGEGTGVLASFSKGEVSTFIFCHFCAAMAISFILAVNVPVSFQLSILTRKSRHINNLNCQYELNNNQWL